MSQSTRARAERFLTGLEKAFGVPRPPRDIGTDPMDFAVWGTVAANVPADAAERGYRALQREFVDWNELRVATWREIGTVLERAKVPDPGRKAVAVRRALQQMYSRMNKLTLEAAVGMNAEDARRYVEGFSDWPSTASGAVYYGYGNGTGVPATMGVVRVAERVGLMAEGIGARKQQQALEKLVHRTKHFRFHHALAGLADVICIHKDPRCEECPVVDLCETGRAWQAEQARAGTPAAESTEADAGERPTPRT
jgi:endonuclease III